MQEFSEEQASQSSSSQTDTIEVITVTEPIENISQYTADDPSVATKPDNTDPDLEMNSFFNKEFQSSINNRAESTEDSEHHLKNTAPSSDLVKIIPEDTFDDDYVKDTICCDNSSVNEDTINCDLENISVAQYNTESSDKMSSSDTSTSFISVKNDNGNCIDVEDTDSDLQLKRKKMSLRTFKKRGRPRKNSIRGKSTEKIPKFGKKIDNTTTVRHVLRSLRNKRLSKKQTHAQSSRSSRKHIKYSNILIPKTKSMNLIKEIQLLEPCNKYKGSSRKKKYQDTNDHYLSDTVQVQEFPHLFKPAPRLPVETKDGQRLSRKYRKKYNICDLRYVHVHRQTTRFTLPSSDVNESQNKNDVSFDILSLVPREVVPVITSNSQLGFREAIIDKRLMRYKRGIPIFRVGRKIPGELS
ncbi:hypothetical protein PORY_001501 [Pneumocystis oryctolagi]|uniref:Uncharacterized protein n=1 Tax=Pneumocystis oryctolagi TaxID=42067 RepID=A0ACB7CCH0_9ASCO|nr:hypothetical protein PORY_001501 [Pneumocystis oryctolagi]